MKAEELFLSIEQCKNLQKLGLDMSDAAFQWFRQIKTWDKKEPSEYRKKWRIERNVAYAVMGFESHETVPTYTLQEVWNKIPKTLYINWKCYFLRMSSNAVYYVDEDECQWEIRHSMGCLTNAYNMLCWIIRKGYLKVKTDK